MNKHRQNSCNRNNVDWKYDIYSEIYKSVFNCNPNEDILACGFEFTAKQGWTWDLNIFCRGNNRCSVNSNCNSSKCHHHLVKQTQKKKNSKKYCDIERKAIIKSIKNWYKYDIQTTFNKKDVFIFCQKIERKCRKVWHSPKKFYHKHGKCSSFISNANTTIGGAAVDCVIQ